MPGVRQTTTAVVQTTTGVADTIAVPDANDLHARFDATEISASDGDAISTWTDETGNGNDLSQSTSSAQPTYKTGIIGGNPVLRFDGSDDNMDVSYSSNVSQAATYFVVAAKRSVSNSNDTIFDGATSSNRHHLWATDDSNSNEWRIYSGSTVGSGTSANTNDHIHSVLFNGTSSVLRLDGTQIASGDAGTQSADGLTVGTRHDQTAPGDFDVGEILIYPQDKSNKWSEIEDYLSDKWGIAI